VTEGGSSGSPLFDNQGRAVGTLTGGESRCDSAHLNAPDWYGMFSYSWDMNGTDSTQVLKYWLDPDSTNVMTLNGLALSVAEAGQDEWVTVFPNPVQDQLNLKTSAPAGKKLDISIHDIWGNLLLESALVAGSTHEMQIDVSGFLPGMYIFGVSDGDRRVVRKIIRQ
jgi:lysyl endopeptidase